jgi:hypothetical protein
LAEHFEVNRSPIHTFCDWGDTPDKHGYLGHAILVYGVDIDQNVHYYDVSDKLDTNRYLRFRKMPIQEFNKRRELPGESLWGRIPILYRQDGGQK